MGINKWLEKEEEKRTLKHPELRYFSKSGTAEGARFHVIQSSWGGQKSFKKFSWTKWVEEDYKHFLIIACKTKKVMGLSVADTDQPDKILIFKRGESKICATYSLKQIKRIYDISTLSDADLKELNKTTKSMQKIFNPESIFRNTDKMNLETKIGVEFSDGKRATILINFKTERNKKIKAIRLLMNVGGL